MDAQDAVSPEYKKYLATKLDLLKRKEKREKELPHLYGFKHYWWSRTYFESTRRLNYLTAANQMGKDLWAETDIPVPGGFKKLKDIQIGDEVFGSDGNPCKVLDIPWFQDNDTFKVHFDDGSSVICGPNHEWICKGPEERFRKQSSRYNQWQVKSLAEIIDHVGLEPSCNRNKYSIPFSGPVEREEAFLFDPYLIGLLIGDGSLGDGVANLTTADKEIEDYITINYKAKSCARLQFSIKNLSPIIKHYGLDCLSYEKSIPYIYKRGSIAQRLALLQGLMDTDGTCDKAGISFFYTSSEKLAQDLIEVVNSLGGKAEIKTKQGSYKKNGVKVECRLCYKVKVDLDMPLFRLTRKLSRQKFQTRYKHERLIVKIEPWKRLRTKCLTVSSPDASFLCTKNYIVTHNSSAQIRKAIHWATEPSLWPKLWPGREPSLFFYIYPSLGLATREFNTKWVKEFLPKGDMKDDPQYGWKEVFKKGEIHSIEFNTGITMIFLSYAMDVTDLQASTPSAIFCDEEPPVKIIPELMMRLEASKGHWHLCCTPTKGQQYFRDIFEQKVFLPDALVLVASLYDATKYEDGTPGQYTIEEVNRRKAILGSEAEIQLRIFGRFVKTEGLVISAFDPERNLKTGGPVPSDWVWFSAVDVGSGGENNHPAAIAFVAVEMGPKGARRGRIVKLWRGDNIETTNPDILLQYRVMKAGLNISRQFYDYASRDFYIHAERAGEFFEGADKSQNNGVGLLNSLFKTGMLTLDDECEDGPKLINEIENFRTDTRKTHAKDDLIDAVRYAISRIVWDFSEVTGPSKQENTPATKEKKKLSRGETEADLLAMDDMGEAIEEMNDLYGG